MITSQWLGANLLSAKSKAVIDKSALAAAKALTFTGESVRTKDRDAMSEVFDKPTPYTLRSLYLQGATPQRLEAKVWFKSQRYGSHYLLPQVEGGQRRLKRFEKHLADAGMLPQGMYVMPGSRMPLDQYGNIKTGTLVKILAALKALPQRGHMANRAAQNAARASKAKRPKAMVDYFVGRPNNASPAGVWERIGETGLKPLLIFTKAPAYKRRFEFKRISGDVAAKEYPVKLRRELQRVGL